MWLRWRQIRISASDSRSYIFVRKRERSFPREAGCRQEATLAPGSSPSRDIQFFERYASRVLLSATDAPATTTSVAVTPSARSFLDSSGKYILHVCDVQFDGCVVGIFTGDSDRDDQKFFTIERKCFRSLSQSLVQCCSCMGPPSWQVQSFVQVRQCISLSLPLYICTIAWLHHCVERSCGSWVPSNPYMASSRILSGRYLINQKWAVPLIYNVLNTHCILFQTDPCIYLCWHVTTAICKFL